MSTVKIVMLVSVLLLLSSSAHAGNSTGVNITVSTLPLPSVSSGGGGSSGGSGGGGVVTDEAFSNIANSDRKEQDIYAGRMATYNFGLEVYRVDIMPLNNEFSVTVKVEELRERSIKIPNAPDGEVYKYFNIYAGTQRIGESTVYFTVPKSNGIVKLMRWNPKTLVWDSLDTVKIDDTHYSAKTTGFSNFAIVRTIPKSTTVEVTTAPQTTPKPVTAATTEQTKQLPVRTPSTPGFELFGAALTLFGIYTLRRLVK
jgi:PGF-pre-PGF domain-containing protein